MDKGVVPEGPYPFRSVACLANFPGQLFPDGGGVSGQHMGSPGTVTDFAPGVFQLRGLLLAGKSPRFAVSGRVTAVAFIEILVAQTFFQALNALI